MISELNQLAESVPTKVRFYSQILFQQIALKPNDVPKSPISFYPIFQGLNSNDRNFRFSGEGGRGRLDSAPRPLFCPRPKLNKLT